MIIFFMITIYHSKYIAIIKHQKKPPKNWWEDYRNARYIRTI
ncbi:hypothetical protein VFSR5_A0588 [Aliivibrio fischeri SR5]|uniref:Uncharacterized protein n=1 Tax=Aliivibrio fischeri SR5 TaxID=1088719 RepID=A0AAV3EPM7_ALIFS|nr:hypothetical protein VFSR5_A0588 [Aliivibrio fischeri SR5]